MMTEIFRVNERDTSAEYIGRIDVKGCLNCNFDIPHSELSHSEEVRRAQQLHLFDCGVADAEVDFGARRSHGLYRHADSYPSTFQRGYLKRMRELNRTIDPAERKQVALSLQANGWDY